MRIITFISILFLIFSCSEKPSFKSIHPNADYFYPIDTIPKVYLYRDISHGLEEEFHRVYALKDQAGPHLVVERYASDGRILEAINYNIDSLKVWDQMVVDRYKKKEKALIYKNDIFPFNLKNQAWYSFKFKGVVDSTLILREIKRNFKKNQRITIMEEADADALVFEDIVRQTVLNPFTKKEQSYKAKQISYFAKGFGLVEWHSLDKKIHYRLEQIISQEDWIKIIAR